MKPLLYKTGSIVTAVAFVISTSSIALAQTTRTFDPVTGAWNTDALWTDDFVPDGAFDEYAQINNAASVAQVGSAVPSVAQLTVGPGRVEIASGGTLTTGPGGSLGTGSATINNNGRINVSSGGIFAPANLTLNGTLQLTGPNASVNVATGGLAINGGSNLVTQINSTTYNPVSVDGLARLRGGAVDVEFSGFTPTAANTFDLIDANVIDGEFTAVNVTGGPVLQPYQTYAVSNLAGGSNGMVARLQLENRLVLSIDRSTGVGSIANLAPSSMSLDGYSISSNLGSIGSAGYNSFDDQNLDGSSWAEIGTLSANAVSELRASGVTALPGSTSRSIGSIYSPNFTELGVDGEDYAFEYTDPSGESTTGIVVYSGDKAHNNLVVNIDPVTGETVLVNESPFTFSFDGYAVTSASGALTTAGWSSLEQQNSGGGDWFEITSNANKVGELKQAGSTTLSQGMSFNLGSIFDPAGAQDLELEFLVAGEAVAQAGVVDYLTAVATVPADLNGDGFVDGLDLGIQLGNFNQVATPSGGELNGAAPVDGLDLGILLGAWNPPATLGASSVPEPTSAALIALSSALGLGCRRRTAMGR